MNHGLPVRSTSNVSMIRRYAGATLLTTEGIGIMGGGRSARCHLVGEALRG
jgi:hypothetical protein